MSNISLNSEKPKLSFWQIWNMSFGFLGIQFGFALQNANTSRIFETLGADTKNLAFYWLAAPVTGLIVQPIIGYLSDRTWHPRWGRRRPFFAIGAILATIALFVMPNSPTLWIAIGMLWIMDGSINISMEPFRAFVGDMLPPEQRTKGFAMQSFFIGVGAVVASALPWIFTNLIGVSNTAPEGQIPDSVKWSFYVGGIAFLVAVMWTVFTTKEYPPSEEDIKESKTPGPLNIKFSPRQYMARGLALLFVGAALASWFTVQEFDPQLYVLCGIFGLFGLSYVIGAIFMGRNKYHNGFVQIVRDFQNMPKTMVQLAYVQFFSWFALFAMWIYSTSAVTSHIYDTKVNVELVDTLETELVDYVSRVNNTDEETKIELVKKEIDLFLGKAKNSREALNVNVANFFLDEERGFEFSEEAEESLIRVREEYNDGADWIGIMFATYNGVAALAAFLLVFIAKKTSRKITHLLALMAGGLGLLFYYIAPGPYGLIGSMVGVGIAWASILSIPYAMLSGSLPPKKMGYYMGIFNFFIVIPQIVAASILGFLVATFFESEFIYAIILGGASMIIAGLLCLNVDDRDEVFMKEGEA
ncbi:MFS transporter [Ekhidna sp.]|uniref:MFS transporter n=1 Tax=Ekhidna sp. TaxID=2608089 RepID=UPI003C7A0A55